MIRTAGSTQVSESVIGTAIEKYGFVVVRPGLGAAVIAGLRLAPGRRRRWESLDEEVGGGMLGGWVK